MERYLFFVDWDDTLLASSFLSDNKHFLHKEFNPSQDVINDFKKLEQNIIKLFETMLKHGLVYIITNAEDEWIELSAKKWLPNVVPYFEKIKLYSARSTHEEEFPDKPDIWKKEAFVNCVNDAKICLSETLHIINLGDSEFEREALFNLKDMLLFIPKSVKFINKPSVDKLHKQLCLIINNMDYICNFQDELDLMLQDNQI